MAAPYGMPSSQPGSMYNNPGRQGTGGQSYNPNPMYNAPNNTAQNGSNPFPTDYLNPFPISADMTRMMVNQANAGTAGGAQQQAMGQMNTAAAQGFGPGSGATAGSLNNIFSNAAGQQAQNQSQIPLQTSAFNTAMQQAAAQLGTAGTNTTQQFQTGQARNATDAINNFLQFLNGMVPNLGG